MKKLSLQHTVLYAKGWYQPFYESNGKRKDIYDDLAITLEMDGYLGSFEGDTEIQRNHSVAYLLVMQFERLQASFPERNNWNLSSFYEGIQPHNCWKYGYITKDYPFHNPHEKEAAPEYNLNTAVVKFILSNFVGMEKDCWNSIKPIVDKLPLKSTITEEKLLSIFGK